MAIGDIIMSPTTRDDRTGRVQCTEVDATASGATGGPFGMVSWTESAIEAAKGELRVGPAIITHGVIPGKGLLYKALQLL